MNIIEACSSPDLFRPFLADADNDITSWLPWFAALRCLYGISNPASRHELLRQCTGRDPANMPAKGFDTALFLTGRRSGKSRMAAIIAANEAVLAGREGRLARGEKGIVPVVAPTMRQSKIVRDYVRAVFDVPLLRGELAEETKDGFELKNGVRIEILSSDWRHVRGFSLLAVVADEICFLGLDEDAKVKSDTELIRALQPALATCGGKLICISSPYARKGWAYKSHQRNFGNDAGTVLVWNAPSRTMNPLLPQAVVDQALQEDLASAKAEYLGEWRDDVGEFLPRHIIEKLVIDGRVELLPQPGVRYCAFVDMSGGRCDSSALAIAHRDGRKVVLDYVRDWKPPFNPQQVIGRMAEDLRRFGLRRITGDNFAAEFTCSAFNAEGISYAKAEKPKSALYIELLPRLCSGEIELLDNELLVSQLSSLERRTRAGGKDTIDHGPNQHDDLANAVAGAAVALDARRVVGALL